MTRCSCLVAVLVLGACASESDPGDPDPDVELTVLDACLAGGGQLVPVTEIDNNVLVAHGEITAMSFAASGQIALASTDGAIKLWSIRDRTAGTIAPDLDYDAAFGEENPPIGALAYGPDAGWIASGRDSGEVALWDPATGARLEGVAPSEAPVAAIDVTADGSSVAIAQAAEIRTWSPGAAASEPLQTGLWGVAAVRYLPDGRLVTAGHYYETPEVEVRLASSLEVEWSWNGDPRAGWVRDLALSPDGGRLAAGGDGFVWLLDLDAAELEPVVVDVPGALVSIAFSPGGEHLFATDDAGQLRILSARDGTEISGPAGSGAVAVRSQPQYDQIVLAEANGIVRFLGCEE